MLSKAEVETKLRKLKPELASNFNVSRIGFFGSYESGQQDENSDLDLIVEFSEPIGWKLLNWKVEFRQFCFRQIR